MDFSLLIQSLQTTLGESLPNHLLALSILILGWLVAVLLRAVTRKGLGFVKLNERIRSESGNSIDLEGGIAKGGYYLVLVLALVAFFNALELPLVSAPLQALLDNVFTFVPNLIAAMVLMFTAWLVATILRKVARKAVTATSLNEKLKTEAGMQPLSESLGNVLYGLVLLLFLPSVLAALGLQGLLTPIQGMVDKILVMLPNILAAVALGGVGWFVARLLKNLVASLLEAAGADRIGQRAGLRGTMSVSRLVGLVVFIFVFVPALTAALNALKIETISAPATQMLGVFMSSIPNIFAAAVIIGVAVFLAEFLSELTTNLLGGMGFDRLPSKLGLGAVLPDNVTASRFIGRLVVFFVMLFALVESAKILGFAQISGIVEMFIRFGGQVLLGVAIIGVGLWIANLAHGAVRRIDRPQSVFVAELVRFTILGVIFAMGLRAMDIANEIVNAAFYLTLGSVAVALALAFGLGGREAAGKQMEHWLGGLRKRGEPRGASDPDPVNEEMEEVATPY